MNPKIKELTDQGLRVLMDYEGRWSKSVICAIKRPYIFHLPIAAIASDEEVALQRAVDLLKKTREVEEEMKDPIPKPEAKYYEGQYQRWLLKDDLWIEGQFQYGAFHIHRFYRQDLQGFHLFETPVLAHFDYKPIDRHAVTLFGRIAIDQVTLQEGGDPSLLGWPRAPERISRPGRGEG